MKCKALPLLILSLSLASLLGATGNWNIVERPYFFYISNTPQFADAIETALTTARNQLIGILDDSLSYKPKIHIEDNLEDFATLIGTAFPDWGAAAALPYRELIAIKSPAHFRLGKSLRELVQHEYAHLALHHRLHHVLPPRWLDEGVAMFVSAEWGWQDNFAISRAVVFNNAVPLREIEKLNRFPQGKAQVAYSESFLAVKYLLDVYGKESFNMLLDCLEARRSVDDALLEATGASYEEFEKEFFDHLNSRYNLMSLFGDLYFLWIFLAVIVFIGFLQRILRRRKRYKKWEEEELLQSTDFDYGDPENPEQTEDEDKPWL